MPNDAAGAPVKLRVNVFILVSKFLVFWTFMCFCERFSYEWEFTTEPQEKSADGSQETNNSADEGD